MENWIRLRSNDLLFSVNVQGLGRKARRSFKYASGIYNMPQIKNTNENRLKASSIGGLPTLTMFFSR